MVIRQSKHFNLQQICDSGQCFRMERVSENCYRVIAFGRSLEILQEGEQCTFFCTPHEFEEIWNDYFDLETDYQSYIEEINQMILLARGGRVGEWDTDSPAGSVGDDSLISDFPAEPYHENPEVYSKSV